MLTFLKIPPQISSTDCLLANNLSLLLHVTCSEEEFTCANGNSIPNSYKCDGDDTDCGSGDQSDEENCPGKKIKYMYNIL